MTSKLTIAMAAGTGGIAPSVVHLAQGFIKSSPDIPGVFFYIGLTIFFGLGALVALLFAETDPRKAFFLGVGLPALIATAQTQGPVKTVSLVSYAYAQVSPISPTAPRIQPMISFRSITDCKGCEIWFADSDGKIISKEVLNSPEKLSVIMVPVKASKFGVSDPKSNFTLVPVPKHSKSDVIVEFDRKYSPLNDLRRGLGDYDLKSYDTNIELMLGHLTPTTSIVPR